MAIQAFTEVTNTVRMMTSIFQNLKFTSSGARCRLMLHRRSFASLYWIVRLEWKWLEVRRMASKWQISFSIWIAPLVSCKALTLLECLYSNLNLVKFLQKPTAFRYDESTQILAIPVKKICSLPYFHHWRAVFSLKDSLPNISINLCSVALWPSRDRGVKKCFSFWTYLPWGKFNLFLATNF